MPIEDRMIFVDIETFGLDPELDAILEIGFRIVDVEKIMRNDPSKVRYATIDDFVAVVWDSPHYETALRNLNKSADAGDEGARIVRQMHTDNGLFEYAADVGLTAHDVEGNVLDFLHGHGLETTEPLCGSSVWFDKAVLRAQMPHVVDVFGHRVVDASSLKELCERFNPDLYAKLATHTAKQGKHRVLPDLEDTVGEFKFYLDNFLFADA